MLRISFGAAPVVLALCIATPGSAALQRYDLRRGLLVHEPNPEPADDWGLFLVTGGGLAQVAREGAFEPGGNGSFSRLEFYVGQFSWNASGAAAFRTELGGTASGSDDDEVVYRVNGAALEEVLREGQPGPGGIGTIGSASPSAPGLEINGSGQISTLARLYGTPGGPNDDSVLLRIDGIAPVAILREGSAAPAGAGVFDDLITTTQWRMNDAAQLLISTRLRSVAAGRNTGIFRGDGVSLVQLVREGDPAPGGGTIGNFPQLSGATGDGRAVFYADLPTFQSGWGLFVADGVALSEIARKGNVIAPLASALRTLGSIEVNEAGEIVFFAGLEDLSGVLLRFAPATGLQVLVHTGDVLPGGAGTLSSFGGLAFDDAGRIVFGANASSGAGMLLRHAGGALETIAASGDPCPGGGTFGSFGAFSLEPGGTLVFSNLLENSSTWVLVRADGASLTELLRSGVAAPDANGFLAFENPPQLAGFGPSVLFAWRAAGTADSSLTSRSACLPELPFSTSRCRPGHGTGSALVEGAAAGSPRLLELSSIWDFTNTFNSPEVVLFESVRARQSPVPDQAGSGSLATSIAWGAITGWTQTGTAWCQATPGIVCTLAGYPGELQTVDPSSLLLRSDFYDLGTWVFHSTGFTATPFVQWRYTQTPGSNVQAVLRGRALPIATTPALPLGAALLLAGGLALASRTRMRRDQGIDGNGRTGTRATRSPTSTRISARADSPKAGP